MASSQTSANQVLLTCWKLMFVCIFWCIIFFSLAKAIARVLGLKTLVVSSLTLLFGVVFGTGTGEAPNLLEKYWTQDKCEKLIYFHFSMNVLVSLQFTMIVIRLYYISLLYIVVSKSTFCLSCSIRGCCIHDWMMHRHTIRLLVGNNYDGALMFEISIKLSLFRNKV